MITAEYNRQHSASKSWGTKAVFHWVNFRPWKFFCSSLEKSCSDNTEIILGKTFMWKCDINIFEITLRHHKCLLGNFSFILGGCFWYSFVMMMIFTIFIVINLFQYINLRSSLPGDVQEKKLFSLYLEDSQENKCTGLNFFPLKFWNFLDRACSIVVFSRVLILDVK